MNDLFSTESSSAPAAVLAVCAIDSLLALGVAEVAQELLPFFEHPHWAVHYRACQAAAKNPSALYTSALKRLAGAAEIPVRIHAAEALARSGEREGADALSRFSQSEDYVERSTAVAVLGTLPAESAKEILVRAFQKEKDLSLRMELAAHLIRFGEEVPLTDFESGLNSENPFIRLSTVTLLSRLSAVAREILRTAESGEPDEFLRSQMRRAYRTETADSLRWDSQTAGQERFLGGLLPPRS
jgi:HEAT repeat protein